MDEVTRILVFTGIFTLSAAVLIILSFVISHRRKLHYKKQLLEQEFKTRENALLQVSRDLHDDIGSSLSGISMLNQLAQEQYKLPNYGTADALFQKINTYTNELIEKVSDMAWLLKPNHDSLAILVKKLKDYSQSLASLKNIILHFDSPPVITRKELSLQQRKAIYLISKEAINNAVKYSMCKNIYYTITSGNEKVKVIIKDDGIGFSGVEAGTGNGLLNMKTRAEEINALLIINSGPGNGTTIELNL